MQWQKNLGLALSLAALSALPLGAAESYSLDAAHSELGFNVGYFNLFKVHGAFNSFSGSIQYDAKDPANCSVEVSIDTASINTRNEMRDKHLRAPDFFDVEKYPNATFKSTKVEAGKDGALTLTGDLNLHGVTKPVVLEAKILGSVEDNMGRQLLAFSAKGKFNRFDYGIAYSATNKVGVARVSNEVEIVIEGQAFMAAGKDKAKGRGKATLKPEDPKKAKASKAW